MPDTDKTTELGDDQLTTSLEESPPEEPAKETEGEELGESAPVAPDAGDEKEEPTEEPPSKPVIAEDDKIDRLRKELAAEQEKARQELFTEINRVNQSSRDAIKDRNDQIKAYFDDQLDRQSQTIADLLTARGASGDEIALEQVKLEHKLNAERRKAEAQAMQQRQAEATQQRQQVPPRGDEPQRWFESVVAEALDDFELSAADREYKESIALKKYSGDANQARKQLRDDIRQAASAKADRLAREKVEMDAKKAAPKSKIPVVDTARGNSAKPVSLESLTAEMEKLLREVGGDPITRAKRNKRIDELDRQIEKTMK